MIANAHKLGMFINIIGKVRKGIRFFRGRLVCIRLKTTIPSIDFSTERERIFSAENILIYLSDICDIGFYFTDHYSVFYEVGIIQSKTHLELFDLLGIYFWIWCCSFLIGALLFRLYRIYKMEKNREAWEVKKKTAYMDIIRYSLDILLAFSYIDSNFITKDNVLIFSFCSNILGLLKFDVI